MLDLIAAFIIIPLLFGVCVLIISLMSGVMFAPFIWMDRVLDRVWGVRHPEPPAYIYMQPPAPPTYQAPPPVQPQPVVHNHYYLLEQPPSAPPLPAPQPSVTRHPSPVTLDGEWRVVDQPVSGADEVQRLLGSGTRPLARRR